MRTKCPLCRKLIMAYLVEVPGPRSFISEAERVYRCACGNGADRMARHVNRHRYLEECLQEYVGSMAANDGRASWAADAVRGAERFRDRHEIQRRTEVTALRSQQAALRLRDAARLAKLPDNTLTPELTR